MNLVSVVIEHLEPSFPFIDGKLRPRRGSDLPKVRQNGKAGQELRISDSQYLFGEKNSLKPKSFIIPKVH